MARTSFTEVQPTGSLALTPAGVTTTTTSTGPTRVDGTAERRLATRNRRRARSSHELTELFAERADLQGVSPVADFFVESVRWSA
ncbi:hypothetical protein [Nocardioides caldifontis]|uniref:hypothetical protein n=1 Tax=Nocardioides caldifontis TaxID=2588938 RepID=UPI0011E02BE9|nr:hypothetical protein [Nocardioides caldifontis]